MTEGKKISRRGNKGETVRKRAATGNIDLKSFSFSKHNRLLKRPDFIRLSTYGEKRQNRYFILLYETGRESQTRFGITVTKKYGNAVARNRMKRRCREFFRHYRYKIQGIWDINLIVKKTAADIEGSLVQKSLEQLFQKMN